MKYPHLGFDPESFDSLYNVNRDVVQREKFLFFAICVAGKNSRTTAVAVNQVFRGIGPTFPILDLAEWGDVGYLKACGIGCYNQRMRSAESYVEWSKDFSLMSAGLDDLLKIKGVSHKTARFFLLYNFPFQPYAAIDTQLLKVLRSKGYDAPKATPTARSTYNYWERKFMSEFINDDCREFVEPDFYARKDFEGWDFWQKTDPDRLTTRPTAL